MIKNIFIVPMLAILSITLHIEASDTDQSRGYSPAALHERYKYLLNEPCIFDPKTPIGEAQEQRLQRQKEKGLTALHRELTTLYRELTAKFNQSTSSPNTTTPPPSSQNTTTPEATDLELAEPKAADLELKALMQEFPVQ